jgi:hypothetical protein
MFLHFLQNSTLSIHIPNPDKKEKRKVVNGLKKDLEKLKKEYGDKAFENDETHRPTMRGFNVANAGHKKKIRQFEKEIEKSQIQLSNNYVMS